MIGLYLAGTCPDCGEAKLEVVRHVMRSGQEHIGAWCHDCKRWGTLKGETGLWPKKERFTWCYDGLRVVDDNPKPECQVEGCTNEGAELHHWAPRKLFAGECEQWPKGWLCKEHHARWHITVTPQLVRVGG